jgi:hypothetical protein
MLDTSPARIPPDRPRENESALHTTQATVTATGLPVAASVACATQPRVEPLAESVETVRINLRGLTQRVERDALHVVRPAASAMAVTVQACVARIERKALTP